MNDAEPFTDFIIDEALILIISPTNTTETKTYLLNVVLTDEFGLSSHFEVQIEVLYAEIEVEE